MLDANFWPALWRLALAADTPPEILLTVWFAESGLDASAENEVHCIGLNQTCPAELGGPGFPTTAEAFKAAPASQQLLWIGPQVLAQVRLNGGGFRSAARYYQANFLPATLPTATRPSDVIAGRHGPYAAAYAANKSLDVQGEGAITLAGLGKYLENVVRAMDVHQGAPLETAIHTAYAPHHVPPGSPWPAPALVLSEPTPTAVGRRGGAAVAIAVASLVGLFARARGYA
jgi:hypothetical protein